MGMLEESMRKQAVKLAVKESQLEDKYQLQQKMMCASERDNEGLLHVMWDVSDDILRGNERRMKMVPGMKRDMALIRSLCEKYVVKVRCTVPPQQRAMMDRHLEHFSYTVGVRNPTSMGKRNKDDWGLWVSMHDLEVLFSTAHDFCMMCSDDLQHQRQCPLRKVMQRIGVQAELTVPDKENKDGYCEYREYI